jgi:flavin-binding protein dodecin
MKPGEVADICGSSSKSFEDAIKAGLAKADRTLRNVRSLWMRRKSVTGESAACVYHVDMWVTFIGEDWQPAA